MSNEMIERVAKALYQTHMPFKWESSLVKNHYISISRILIAAMKEPSDSQRRIYFKMKRDSGCSEFDSVFFDAEWERMVDAALTDE